MQTVRWWWNRRVCGGERKAGSTTETRLEMQIPEYAGGSSRQRKKKKNEAGYGVKREEKVETRKGGGWKKRSGSGGGERKVLCLCSVYTGQAKEKAGKNGIRNVQPEVDTVSAPWTPVSRNCWINNCRTEQKNRKHGNSVIYCASSVRYCENSETFVCEGEKM